MCKLVQYVVASHVGKSDEYGDFGEFLSNRQMYKSVPYMVASHIGESGDFGEYGKYGEFLANMANSCQRRL